MKTYRNNPPGRLATRNLEPLAWVVATGRAGCHLPSSSPVPGYFKTVCLILLLPGLTACSEKQAPAPQPVLKRTAGFHRYVVTFAAVKLPDSTLTALGFPAYGEPGTPESRRQLAAHVLAHAAEFSIRTPTGNCLPIVWSNGETRVTVLPDAKQEARDFELLGMMTKGFDAGVSVREEDERGEVYCDWYCSCGVHFKQPVGGSTDHGMGGGCGCGIIPVGQPEMWPLLHDNGVSLWLLAGLNRN